jgi:MoxR-like ATPase
VKFGASPRAALGLAAAGRARALLHGRINTSFEDVRAVAASILQHRIILDYTSRLQGRGSAGVVQDILEEVPFQDREAPPAMQDTSRAVQ